jgi:hypothetical protein
MDNKIEIGDTVECIEKPAPYFGITVGNKYIVKDVNTIRTEIEIRCDEKFSSKSQWIFAKRFKKINSNNNEQMNRKYHVRVYQDGAFQTYGQTTAHKLVDAISSYNICRDANKNLRYAIVMVKDEVETIIIEEGGGNSMPIPVINGYQMEYKKDGSCVKFGCAFLDVTLMMNLRTVMNSKNYKGNRHVKTICLDSDVVMSAEDIGNIVKYIENIQNEK